MWELFTESRGPPAFVFTLALPPPPPLALPLTQLYDFLASLSPLAALWLAIFTAMSLSLLILPPPVKKSRRTHVKWAIVKVLEECRYQDIKVLQDAADDFLPEWFDDLRSSILVWGVVCGSLVLTALFWQQVNLRVDVLEMSAMKILRFIVLKVFVENERLVALTRLGVFLAAQIAGPIIGLASLYLVVGPLRVRHATAQWIVERWEAVKERVADVDMSDVVAEPEDLTNRKISDDEIRACKKAKDRGSVDDVFEARRSPAATSAQSESSHERTRPSMSSTESPSNRTEASSSSVCFDKERAKTTDQKRKEPTKCARERVDLEGLEEVLQAMEDRGMPVRKAFNEMKSPEVRNGMSSSQPQWSHRWSGTANPTREQTMRMVQFARQQQDSQAIDAVRWAITREMFADHLPAPSTSWTSSSSNDTNACSSTFPLAQNILSSNAASSSTNNATAPSSAPSSTSSNGNACHATTMRKANILSLDMSSPWTASVTSPSITNTTATTASSARPAYFFSRPENFHAFNPRPQSSSTSPPSLFPPPRTFSLLQPQPQALAIPPQRPPSRVPRSDSVSSLATTMDMDGVSECGSGSTVSCFLDASDDGNDSDGENHEEEYQFI